MTASGALWTALASNEIRLLRNACAAWLSSLFSREDRDPSSDGMARSWDSGSSDLSTTTLLMFSSNLTDRCASNSESAMRTLHFRFDTYMERSVGL